MLEKMKPQGMVKTPGGCYLSEIFLKVLHFILFLNILKMSQWLVGHHGQNMMNVYV